MSCFRERYFTLLITALLAGVFLQCQGSALPAQENVDRLFRFSLGLYKQEFFEESVEQLEKLVKFYPEYEKTDVVLYILGESYYRLGRYDEAHKTYHRLLTLLPESKLVPEAANAGAWSLFELGRFEEAAALFRQVSEEYSSRQDLAPEARFRMAQAMVKAGSNEKAVTVLEQIVAREPPGPFAADAVYSLADIFYEQGEYKKASVQYKKILNTFKESSYVESSLYSLAFAQMKLADFESAQNLFSQLKERTADLSMKREATLRQAKALCNLKQYQKALEILQACEPGDHLGDEIGFVRSLCRFRLKEYETARAGFLELCQLYPESPFVAESMELAAESLFRRERFKEAIAGFFAVVKTYQGTRWHESAGLHLGLCYFNLGQMDEAKDVLEASYSRFPDGPLAGQILFALGEAYYAMENYERAEDTFRKVLTLTDEMFKPASFHRLGVLTQIGNRHEETLDFLDRLITGFPENSLVPDALYRKGESLVALKRFRAAVDVFTVLANEPNSPLVPDSLYKAGESYKALKELDMAIETYTNLIERFPESALVPMAKKARAWCSYSSGLIDDAVIGYRELANSDLPADQLAEAQYWLGKAFEKKGDFKQARTEYLKMGILYPESKLAGTAMFKVGEC